MTGGAGLIWEHALVGGVPHRTRRDWTLLAPGGWGAADGCTVRSGDGHMAGQAGLRI